MNIKLQKVLDWKANKPKTDGEWALDVEKESLHVKFDKQLADMEKSHAEKLPHVQKDLDKFNNFPEAVRYELNDEFSQMFEEQGNPTQIEGKTKQQWIDGEFAEQLDYYNWKVEKLGQSVERILKERGLRKKKVVTRKPLGTTYYIDLDAGSDAAAGTATGTAWLTLDKFTENARSAGDIAIVRRATGGLVATSDLLFTSDGTIVSPITIEADYANAFGDDVDLSVTATATLTFGSKTITFSADISGVLAAGDFIYASGDAAKEFAYEVASVVTTTVTLYLPYKGDQAGSGKTMTNMKANPIWNTKAGNFQVNFDADNFWKIQGIHFRGTDGAGVIEIDSSYGHSFRDCIIEGNGSSDWGVRARDETAVYYFLKSRIFDVQYALPDSFGLSSQYVRVKNSLIDNDNTSNSFGVYASNLDFFFIEETEFKNSGAGDIRTQTENTQLFARNVLLTSSAEFSGTPSSHNIAAFFKIEDKDGVIGKTIHISSGQGASLIIPIIESDTGTVRSGGSNVSMKITPSTNLSTVWEHSRIKLFEIPFYATTISKQYDVYFRPTATADWTADPTATELWIELEYWGHASNNFRRITKSTGVIDMNGSTAWQALTVTVAPAQAGVAYLRCYYAKTKESSKANTFFVDPLPVVT